MARLVGFLLFLAFAQDRDCAYVEHLGAPLGWAFDLLLEPTPLKIRPFDLALIAVLVIASFKRERKGPYVAPMRNALLLMVLTTVMWFIYGISRGGEFRFASWQTYLILSAVLVAFTVAATHRTARDFYGLAKWLLAVAMYRGVMCWISYFTWARGLVGESGAFLTGHEDTICWVVSILLLIVGAIQQRSLLVTARNVALIVFFLAAIQWNSRRLAWVSLAMGLVVLYTLFPRGTAKRRVNRLAWVAAPLVALYVVVGWGRPNRIFLPLRSLSSVSTQEDTSTLARNAENLGLIATANYSHAALGSGWGKPYVFLTTKYDISKFELWQYVPHNSILGLLAFTGIFGFAGFWLALPTAVFLNARTARLGADTGARSVAMVGVAQMIVCANQLYGDMGIFSPETMYVLAVGYGMALRLPLVANVWSTPKSQAATTRFS